MHLYRKVVPKIARDVIRTFTSQQLIEVEDGRMEEAELDLAAVMVEYLNAEDRVAKEARDVLARRGLGQERFAQLKKSIGDARGIKVGEEGLDYVLAQLLEALFSSKNIAEIFAEDHDLRKVIKEIIMKYLSVPEELDRDARARLKNLREGSPEWDIEYPRVVAQLKRQRGLA